MASELLVARIKMHVPFSTPHTVSYLLLARLIGQTSNGRWRVGVCNTGGRAGRSHGRPTLHGGPVVLRPDRATPCLYERRRYRPTDSVLYSRWSNQLQNAEGLVRLCLLNKSQLMQNADRPARHATSRQSCCTQKWTLSMIKLATDDCHQFINERSPKLTTLVTVNVQLQNFPSPEFATKLQRELREILLFWR